ncbi:MAG TPA: hypothetical protein VFA56_02490 [Gaiellaceae bacterium]|nr:hypothetical protein [Gaiellaceae bacterium]
MRVKVANPALAQRLISYLEFDANVVVNAIDEDEVEVSFLGSFNADAQRMQTELRLRAWISANPGAVVVMRE